MHPSLSLLWTPTPQAPRSASSPTASLRSRAVSYTHLPPQRALVTITFEGEAIQVEEGTTVAAAVLDRAGGETRTTARKHDGRGPYCHMGVCYECLMEIDGVPNQQSCLIPVREGMSVKRQSGAPSFRTEENK